MAKSQQTFSKSEKEKKGGKGTKEWVCASDVRGYVHLTHTLTCT